MSQTRLSAIAAAALSSAMALLLLFGGRGAAGLAMPNYTTPKCGSHGSEPPAADSSECPMEARSVCKSQHSECVNGRRSGYTCSCKEGYHGNPYVAEGCQDAGSCRRVCGESTVTFPFGMGSPHCYLPGFNLTCDTKSRPPRLLLCNGDSALRVMDISLGSNTVRVGHTGALIVADDQTSGPFRFSSIFTVPREAPFTLSTSNELILTGCNMQATLLGYRNPAILSGCASFCCKNETSNVYCNGIGCCRARISMSMDGMPDQLSFKYFDDQRSSIPQPGYVFVAEEGWFHGQKDLSRSRSSLEVPILLDWEVLVRGFPAPDKSHRNCSNEVASRLCKSKNSYCTPGNRGYSCHCNDGYHGNPYTVEDGCTGQGKFFTTGRALAIGAGACLFCILIIVLPGIFVVQKIKQIIVSKDLKKKFFMQNRGQLFQQLVHQRTDIAERMIITLEELVKGTNNFDNAHELGHGGHGTVYKGILSDLHVVAIKKSKIVIQREIDEFINEVVILSQINHKNIVKLLGCCLEVEVPLLVYEFISNGTLHDHLHGNGQVSLSWANRLRIGTETAKALAYIHSATLVPVIHRDIKSTNILLDDALTAKVSDFGASRHIQIEKTWVTTKVQGTIGYLDPTYYHTGRLTEKSDVYSFGVVLVELLTKKMPFLYSSYAGLVEHFVSLLSEGNLVEILDPQVVEEGGKEILEVATIAASCTKFKAEDRPTMRQVEMLLEGIKASKEHHSSTFKIERLVDSNIERKFPSTHEARDPAGATRRYSLEKEFLLSSSYPR